MLYPHPQIYHHLKTIFVHVPKTAGTSIEQQLKQSKSDPVGGHTTALAYKRKYPECFDTYYKFTVTRDPLDRFVSAYCYLREFPIHAALQNEVVHKHDSLAAFVTAVESDRSLISKIVHLMPQHQFVCDTQEKVLVDTVYRFERLEEAWGDICRRLGLGPIAMVKMNRSKYERAPAGHREQARGLVRELYAKDYEIFQYDPEAKSPQEKVPA